MKQSHLALLLAAAGGVWLACSNATGPRPTVAGTWHITVGTLGSGSLTPPSFDAVVTAAGADSFLVSLPTLTWSVGTIAFDSAPQRVRFSDTTTFGFGEVSSAHTQRCQFIQIWGHKNARLDTLTSATVTVFSADTVPGGYCAATTSGSATAHK